MKRDTLLFALIGLLLLFICVCLLPVGPVMAQYPPAWPAPPPPAPMPPPPPPAPPPAVTPISKLPAAKMPLSGAELVPIVQNGSTRRTTVSALVGGVNPDGSNATGTWPISITGNAATASLAEALAGDVTFDASGKGVAAGAVWNGSGTPLISYNTLGAAAAGGANATGTWPISITGSAATASSAGGLTGTLGVANGGTGLTSAPANGQVPIGNGTGYALSTLTAGSGISVTNGAGSITISGTGVTSVSGGTTGLTPSSAATGAVVLSGTLAVANGGTGVTTSTGAGNVVLSNSPTMSNVTISTSVLGNTTLANGIQGEWTANFSTNPGAGTGATAVCATSVRCDQFSGTVIVTTGTSPAAGSFLHIGRQVSLVNFSTCLVNVKGAAGQALGASDTESNTSIDITTASAPAANTAYTVAYICGGY